MSVLWSPKWHGADILGQLRRAVVRRVVVENPCVVRE
jgi:hypothetical protein